jgi:hypothetical protein
MSRALWNGKVALGALVAGALGVGIYIGTQAGEPQPALSPLRCPVTATICRRL